MPNWQTDVIKPGNELDHARAEVSMYQNLLQNSEAKVRAMEFRDHHCQSALTSSFRAIHINQDRLRAIENQNAELRSQNAELLRELHTAHIFVTSVASEVFKYKEHQEKWADKASPSKGTGTGKSTKGIRRSLRVPFDDQPASLVDYAAGFTPDPIQGEVARAPRTFHLADATGPVQGLESAATQIHAASPRTSNTAGTIDLSAVREPRILRSSSTEILDPVAVQELEMHAASPRSSNAAKSSSIAAEVLDPVAAQGPQTHAASTRSSIVAEAMDLVAAQEHPVTPPLAPTPLHADEAKHPTADGESSVMQTPPPIAVESTTLEYEATQRVKRNVSPRSECNNNTPSGKRKRVGQEPMTVTARKRGLHSAGRQSPQDDLLAALDVVDTEPVNRQRRATLRTRGVTNQLPVC